MSKLIGRGRYSTETYPKTPTPQAVARQFDAVVFDPDPPGTPTTSIRSDRSENQSPITTDPVVGPPAGATNLGSDDTGGVNPGVSGNYATVGGGLDNAALGDGSTVSGGVGNQAAGEDAAVPGGHDNMAAGPDSAAVGNANAAFPFSIVAGGTAMTISGFDATSLFGLNDELLIQPQAPSVVSPSLNTVAAPAPLFNGTDTIVNLAAPIDTFTVFGIVIDLQVGLDFGPISGAHVEGTSNAVLAGPGHAEGLLTTAAGPAAHAEGAFNFAGGTPGGFSGSVGFGAHAEGVGAVALFSGEHSQASGPALTPPVTAASRDTTKQTNVLVMRGTTPGAAPGESVTLGFGISDPPLDTFGLTTGKSYIVSVDGVATDTISGAAFGFTEKFVFKAGTAAPSATFGAASGGDPVFAGSALTATAPGSVLEIVFITGTTAVAASVAARVETTEVM